MQGALDGAASWATAAARAGYATKGFVYVAAGALTLRVLAGAGGAVAGPRGALAATGQQPFGRALLVAVGLGLVLLATWQVLQAVFDPEHHARRRQGLARLVVRAQFLVSCCVHLALAAAALRLVAGSGSTARDAAGWTALVMRIPLGRVLVAGLGLGVGSFAVRQFQRAWKASFMRTLDVEDAACRKWVERVSRLGLCARGAVFVVVAWFLVRAAIHARPDEARGLDGALQELAAASHGPWLLGGVAVGLVAYGAYCFSRARWSRFAAP